MATPLVRHLVAVGTTTVWPLPMATPWPPASVIRPLLCCRPACVPTASHRDFHHRSSSNSTAATSFRPVYQRINSNSTEASYLPAFRRNNSSTTNSGVSYHRGCRRCAPQQPRLPCRRAYRGRTATRAAAAPSHPAYPPHRSAAPSVVAVVLL